MFEKFKRNKFIVFLLQIFNPSYGTCRICGLPFNKCEGHDIMINDSEGFHCVCEYCWKNESKEKNRSAVTDTYYMWKRSGIIPHSWSSMMDAFNNEWRLTH